MKIESVTLEKDRQLLNIALLLSIITILYNLLEGVISVFFGASDDTLALFGFGVDSFVEVISGIGIAHMVWRMKTNSIEKRDSFEVTALRITGVAFYLLTAGLITGAAWIVYSGSRPETTLAGIIISVVSIITMYFLYRKKLEIGENLDSAPIISAAKCTKTCFYLSFILLGSSGLYELTGISFVDVLGSLGIAWYAFREGREAFGKARKGRLACCDDHCD
jgi:hypothetical protein